MKNFMKNLIDAIFRYTIKYNKELILFKRFIWLFLTFLITANNYVSVWFMIVSIVFSFYITEKHDKDDIIFARLFWIILSSLFILCIIFYSIIPEFLYFLYAVITVGELYKNLK